MKRRIARHADTDHGTVLHPHQAAIVWDPEDGYTLLIPKGAEELETVPAGIAALSMVLIKLQDEDYEDELCREMEELTEDDETN